MKEEDYKKAETLHFRMKNVEEAVNHLIYFMGNTGRIILEDSRGNGSRLCLPKDLEKKILRSVKSELDQELELIKSEFEKL